MSPLDASNTARAWRVICGLAGILASIASLLTLSGWILTLPRLTDWVGSGISMKANTAVVGILAGAALPLLAWQNSAPRGSRYAMWLVRFIALITIVISVLTLFEHVSGRNIGIDTILIDEPAGMRGTAAPGRMGIPAASCLALIGVGLLLVSWPSRSRAGVLSRGIGAALGYLALCITAVPAVGYAFGADFPFTVPKWTGIAFQTAFVIVLLAVGLISAAPEFGIPAILSKDRNDPGHVLARRLLVPVVLLPLLLGWLHVQGHAAGLFDSVFGAAVFALLMAVALGWIVFGTAKRLSQSTQAVRENETRKSAILESALDCIITMDAQGRIVDFNPAAERTFRFSREQAIGKTGSELIVPERLRQSHWDGLRRYLETGEHKVLGRRIEMPALRADGHELSVELAISATVLPVGRPFFTAYLRDITERKRAEAALEQSEQRFRTLSELAPVGMFETDAEGNCLYVNDRWCQIAGMTPERARGQGWADALHPEDRDRVFNEWYEAAKTRREFSSEYRFVTPTGSVTWVVGRGVALRNEQGAITGHIGTLVDVTDRRLGEQSRMMLAAIVQASDDAIISKDLKGTILTWNLGAQRLLGYSAEEVIGKPVTILVPEDRINEETMILDRVRRGPRIDHFETVRRRKDGSLVDISLSVSPLIDEQGSVIGVSKIARDITQRKRAEQVLARHAEELEEAVRKATEELRQANERQRAAERLVAIGTLAAGLGHDMANLLMPINIRLDVLGESSPEQRVENIQVIKQSIEYLQNLSTSLRMLAADPKKPGGSESRVNLHQWWDANRALLKSSLPRGVQLEASFPKEFQDLRIEPHQLTQVVFNLVQNAGEAMRPMVEKGEKVGEVRVWAESTENVEMVKLGVTDNGPGMSDEVKAHCLEPFFSTKSRALTTGMGLALVQGIAQQVAGTIEIQTSVGVGTTFVLTLPAWRVDPPLPRNACLDLSDPRARSFAKSWLDRLGFKLHVNERAIQYPSVSLWITDSADVASIQRFLKESVGACVVYLGASDVDGCNGRIFQLDPQASLIDLRNTISEAVKCSEARTAANIDTGQANSTALR